MNGETIHPVPGPVKPLANIKLHARRNVRRVGKVRPIILLWALGVPLPIVLLILLLRGCM